LSYPPRIDSEMFLVDAEVKLSPFGFLYVFHELVGPHAEVALGMCPQLEDPRNALHVQTIV
jgi:hypothetical protein